MKLFARALMGAMLFAMAAFVLAMFLGQRRLLFENDTGGDIAHPRRLGFAGMAVARFPTADGLTLSAWRQPARPGCPTIVYFHGNDGDIASRAFKLEPLLHRGYGVLLVEYRGYGGNPGSPSEEGVYEDGRAAIRYLSGQGVPPGQAVFMGESLGTGVAVKMALVQDATLGRTAALDRIAADLDRARASLAIAIDDPGRWSAIRWRAVRNGMERHVRDFQSRDGSADQKRLFMAFLDAWYAYDRGAVAVGEALARGEGALARQTFAADEQLCRRARQALDELLDLEAEADHDTSPDPLYRFAVHCLVAAAALATALIVGLAAVVGARATRPPASP